MAYLTVQRGPARLAARTFGRRGPHLILIHGLASSQHIWDLVLPALEKNFRVTTYDQRGHGESSRPTSGYSFDEVTKDLRAVARAVGAKRPVLVGHSYGANVSIDYAARHPKDVAGVMTVDGGMGSMSEVMSWKEAAKELAPPKLKGVHVDVVLEMIRGRVGRSWTHEHELIVRSLFFIDREGHITPCLARSNHMKILRAMYGQKPKELLARIEVPTLMFSARPPARMMKEEGDFYAMKKRSVAAIRRSNPKIKIEWISSIHDIPLDKPRELAQRIARFARQKSVSG